MTSKYTPLEQYLKNQPVNVHELTLTFEKIEEILSARLPKSAYQHLAWWGNEVDGMHVQSQGWMAAGWCVESVNQSQYWVRFHRVER